MSRDNAYYQFYKNAPFVLSSGSVIAFVFVILEVVFVILEVVFVILEVVFAGFLLDSRTAAGCSPIVAHRQ